MLMFFFSFRIQTFIEVEPFIRTSILYRENFSWISWISPSARKESTKTWKRECRRTCVLERVFFIMRDIAIVICCSFDIWLAWTECFLFELKLWVFVLFNLFNYHKITALLPPFSQCNNLKCCFRSSRLRVLFFQFQQYKPKKRETQ